MWFLAPRDLLCISARRASFLATKQGEQPGSAASAAEHTAPAPFLYVHTSTTMEHISNGLVSSHVHAAPPSAAHAFERR